MDEFRRNLIMVLDCTVSKKVKQRVERYVKNGWSLAATEEEIAIAFARRDEINRLAESEGRMPSPDEVSELSMIVRCYVAVKRGLSQIHYDQWIRARRSMSKTKAAQFDASLIRRGELLNAYSREYVQLNRYQKAARAV
jgi:hypothetical protein